MINLPMTFAIAAHELPAIGSWEYIKDSNVLNILIVAIFLAWIFNKVQVGDKLKGYQERIIDNLDKAEAKQEQAEQKLQEVQSRLGKLDAEVSEILADAKANAKTMAERIIKDAEADAQKIMDQAHRRVALEEKQRLAEVQDRLMTEAIVATRELLENTLTKDDRIQSVEAFIEQIPQLAAATGGKQ